MAGGIALSVVVRVVGGSVHLRRCLNRLVPQIAGRPVEIIVPCDRSLKSIRQLEAAFPQVRFLGLDVGEGHPCNPGTAHLLYDLRSACGFRAAQGAIVASIEDYGLPASDWCEQVLQAHQLPHAAIGGAVEHAGRGLLNWAVYFLDFGRYRLPLGEGRVLCLSDVNVSYKRAALDRVREAWDEGYSESRVNGALARLGAVLWLTPRLLVHEDRGRLHLLPLLVQRFWWGRLYGARRAQAMSPAERGLHGVVMPAMPAVLVARIAYKVCNTRRSRREFVAGLPFLPALAVAWCAGELMGYITGRAGPPEPAGRRVTGSRNVDDD